MDLGKFVDKDTDTLTGVIDFGEARTGAFGINHFTRYENHVGSIEYGHWSPYNKPAGEQHPALSVGEVLIKALWDALWEKKALSLKRNDYEEVMEVTLRMGTINRYFVSRFEDIKKNEDEG